MPTFHDQPKPAEPELGSFEVLYNGGKDSPSIAEVNIQEIARMDPLLPKAQKLAQDSMPDIPLGWLGAVYDDFGTRIRMILGYEVNSRPVCHLFVFNDDQVTIDLHETGAPLVIVARAHRLAQEFMNRTP